MVTLILRDNVIHYMKKVLGIRDFILYCWEDGESRISVYYQKEPNGFVYTQHINLPEFVKWQNPYIRKHKVNKIKKLCLNQVK